MTGETYSVEIHDLVKRRGGTLAVDHVSLQVRRGEFFSLVGPSGSGKTSLLRLLAGFDVPDAGEILVDGRSVRGVPPDQRPVNMVFQHYALFPHLSVSGNVAFGLEMKQVPRSEIRTRVQAALDMVKLAGKSEQLPSHLSGGEQQRVALARALVNRPAVVLLDEPLGALDQQLRQDMQVELKTIQQQVGLTFIYVTHHQEEALTMSDRVAVLDRGHVFQVGTPQEVYETPASAFVAGFIGVSNRLSGRVVAVDGAHCTIEPSELAGPRVRAARADGVLAGGAVTVMLRPERLRLARDAGPHGFENDGFENEVKARVEKAVYNGNEMQYWVRLSERLVWKARVPNSVGAEPYAPGEGLFVRWHASDGVILPE